MLIALVVAGEHIKNCNMTDSDGNKLEDSAPIIESSISQFKKNFCKYCGKGLQPDAAFCSACGKAQNNVTIQQPSAQIMQQPVVQHPYVVSAYQQPQPVVAPNVSTNTTTVVVEGGKSNSMGIAGFIIALLGLIFCLVPIVNLLLWFLGLVFSFVGLFKAPRGMAIAGFVLSFVIIFIIIATMGATIEFLDSVFSK